MESIIICSIWGVLMMLFSAFKLKKDYINIVAFWGSIFVFCFNLLHFWDIELIHISYPKLLFYDNFRKVILLIFSFLFIFYFLISWKNFKAFKFHQAEYVALLFFIFTGIHILIGFSSLLTLFLGAEIISIPLYVLAGSDKKNIFSNEASLKYFLSGSFFSAFMLLGIALIYGSQHTFDVSSFSSVNFNSFFTVGVILLIVSLAFKTSVAPFHFWAPDVYDGSPSVFSGLMSGLVKSAFFISFFAFFQTIFGMQVKDYKLLIIVMIVLTMFLGNITAVFQTSYKRLLSYSSVAQTGFMMLAILSVNAITMKGLILYSASYSLASLCLFSILFYMEDNSLKNFNGLGKKDPFLAILITIFLFSLIGIPATGGFISKYFMLWGIIKNDNHIWVAIIAVVFSTISVYYYFKILKAMFFEKSIENTITVPNAYKRLLFVASVIIIMIGIRPHWLLDLLYY